MCGFPYQNIRSLVHICRKRAAHSCGKFAANAFFVCKFLFWRTVLAHNVRRKYAVHSCRALIWHAMCAASMQRTVVAHYSGTQCALQVCSAQVSRTILVSHKFAAHSCRALRCSAPHPNSHPTPHLVYHPTAIFFLVSYPQGECEKKCWDGRSVTKIKYLGWGWDKM